MTYNDLKYNVLKFKTFQDLKNNEEIYNECLKSGRYEELTKHLHGKKRILTNDDLRFIASFYDNRTTFNKEEPSIYRLCYKRKILDEVCSHMKVKIHFNVKKEDVLKLALKYNSRMEFKNSKDDGWAYHYAVKNRFIDEACSHMEAVGNKYYRCIYVYEIPENKTCYVGLTYSLHRRHLQHQNPKFYSAINEYCKKENIKLPQPIQKTDYLPKAEASEMEKYYVNEYKNKGWLVLNKQKPGNLGGSKDNITYTKEMCIELAKKYNTRAEFAKDYVTAYKYVRLYGWKNEVFAHINDDEIRKKITNSARIRNSKKVIQYDMDGNIIKVFSSIQEAHDKTGISKSSIENMCLNKIKYNFVKKCVFKFDGENFDKDIKKKIEKYKEERYKNAKRPKERKVGKLDENGNVIEIFKNCKIAGEAIKRSGKTVQYACRNSNRTAGGFHWKFMN